MDKIGGMKRISQKSLFENPQGLNSLIPQATDLFVSGMHWLKVLSEKEQKIKFTGWAKLIRGARGKFR